MRSDHQWSPATATAGGGCWGHGAILKKGTPELECFQMVRSTGAVSSDGRFKNDYTSVEGREFLG
jgi:hypothetical protein